MNALRRWTRNLGLALAIAATASPAQATPRVAGDSHPVSVARRPAHRIRARGIDTGSLPLCPDLRSTPLGSCPHAVRVPLALGDEPSLLDARRFHTEQNLAESVKREVEAAARLRSLGARVPMLYGIEAEPVKQFQLKREILVLLAKLSGDSRIMRAATAVGPGSSLRAFAESEALERTRVRATFVQIEEARGPTPLSTTPAQYARFASMGASLFTFGALVHPFVRRGMGDRADNLEFHPQPWPPGLTIKGTFNAP